MSAFLYHTASRKLAEQTIGQIKKNHIIYIVQTAYELNECDYYEYPSDLKVMAELLWNEHIKSLQTRYPYAPEVWSGTASFTDDDMRLIYEFDIAQFLKSIACLEYQSCEHKGWKRSKARRYLDTFKELAIQHLPGYEDAVWGAPEPIGKFEKAEGVWQGAWQGGRAGE